MTDITLDTKHWWKMGLVWCPGYMIANIWGGFYVNKDAAGSIYHVENWREAPLLTLVGFIFFGFVQGGLFVCLAKMVEKIKPSSKEDVEEELPTGYTSKSDVGHALN